MLVEMPRTDGEPGTRPEPILVPGNPVKMSKMADGPDTRVPWVGEHTAEVLRDELGLSPAEYERLRAARVVA